MKSLLTSSKVIISAVVILIILSSILTGVIVKSTSTDLKVKRQLSLGQKYLSEIKYEEAIIAFKEVIKIEPRNVKAYLGIATSYVALEEPQEAINWLEQGIKAIEDKGEVIEGCEQLYIKASEIHKEIGEVDNAVDVLERGYRFTLSDMFLELIEKLVGYKPDASLIISEQVNKDLSGNNIGESSDSELINATSVIPEISIQKGISVIVNNDPQMVANVQFVLVKDQIDSEYLNEIYSYSVSSSNEAFPKVLFDNNDYKNPISESYKKNENEIILTSFNENDNIKYVYITFFDKNSKPLVFFTNEDPITFSDETKKNSNMIPLAEDKVIVWKDSNFEAGVREILNKPSGDIYLSEVWYMDQITLDNYEIEIIDDIKYFQNLTYLSLGSNHINRINELKNLANLKILYLQRNSISDISALENIISLQTLNLYENNISNIDSLKGLTNIEDLMIDLNQISDISPLKSLTKLTSLSISVNDISDIEVLRDLKSLQKFYAYNVKVIDWSPINHVPEVYRFDTINGITIAPGIKITYNDMLQVFIDKIQIEPESIRDSIISYQLFEINAPLTKENVKEWINYDGLDYIKDHAINIYDCPNAGTSVSEEDYINIILYDKDYNILYIYNAKEPINNLLQQ